MDRCEKCGRLHPQFATGRSNPKALGARQLIYEGYSPGGKSFEYRGSNRCMVDRHGGTPNQLGKRPFLGNTLRQALVELNKKEV
jgi:hypothetical protein